MNDAIEKEQERILEEQENLLVEQKKILRDTNILTVGLVIMLIISIINIFV